jgi:hypothetical protein
MRWYRVDANYGDGWVFVSEANSLRDAIDLEEQAKRKGAKETRVYLCESVPTEELRGEQK